MLFRRKFRFGKIFFKLWANFRLKLSFLIIERGIIFYFLAIFWSLFLNNFLKLVWGTYCLPQLRNLSSYLWDRITSSLWLYLILWTIWFHCYLCCQLIGNIQFIWFYAIVFILSDVCKGRIFFDSLFIRSDIKGR